MNSIFNNKFYNNKFTDLYPDESTFKNDYNTIGLPKVINDTNIKTLYYLLYARFGNSTISNSDNYQFKVKLFSIIWQYGGTWQKRLEIQEKLRGLSLDDNSDIYKGGKAIYNTALNPGTSPSSQSLEELSYINSQNTTNYKKSKLEGLELLTSLLETDVTADFLNKFKDLFIKIIAGDTQLYVTVEEDEND